MYVRAAACLAWPFLIDIGQRKCSTRPKRRVVCNGGTPIDQEALVFYRNMFVVCCVAAVGCEPTNPHPQPSADAGTIPSAATPPFTAIVHIRAHSNGPRTDARCPDDTALVGGGCSCGESAAGPLRQQTAMMTSLPDAITLDTFVCVCETAPDGSTGGSSAQAACMYGVKATSRPSVFVPNLCFPPYANGCPAP